MSHAGLGVNRAQRMLRVIADGRPHSRQEILRAADTFYLTNNAASELRDQGYEITHDRKTDTYQLVGALDSAALPSAAESSASALLSSTVETPSQVSGGSGALQLFDPPARGAYDAGEAA